MRHTKMIATVGPASNSPQMLEALLLAGVDLFRLNFSHGTHESHRAVYQTIRDVVELGPGVLSPSCRISAGRKFEPARSPADSRSPSAKASSSRSCRGTSRRRTRPRLHHLRRA